MVRIVAICLIISNIAVGAAGYFIVREMNRSYSELLQSSLPALNTVRALSWQLSRVQRGINRLGDAHGPERAALLQRQATDKDDADGLLHQVVASIDAVVPPGTKDEIQAAHAAYTGAVGEWRALIAQDKPAEAAVLVVNKVRPAYDAYENLLDQLATVIHDNGITGNKKLSAQAGKLGGGLVLMASWPLWLGGLAILFVGLSVTALGILLKWKAPDVFQS
jgi:hypothetical protein